MENMGWLRIIEENRRDAIRWTRPYEYKTKRNINEIPVGTRFYEVNLNNLYIGRQKQKK
jgi:hypothetical protein